VIEPALLTFQEQVNRRGEKKRIRKKRKKKWGKKGKEPAGNAH